jgi:hypothetical protein
MHTPSGGVQMPQLSLQQTSPGGQVVGPHGTPAGVGSQKISMHPPPIGAQIPQLGLQQYSPAPHIFPPHGSPTGGLGGQSSRVHPDPSGTHRLQLSLQQYSPGPQIASLQSSPPQTASEHGIPTGTQTPPQFGQHVVPSMHRIAAHGL